MFNVGDKVVYPMHGAGTIEGIEEKDILGEKQAYYIIKMPGEVKVMVPTAKAEGIGTLKYKFLIKDSLGNRRKRYYR